MLCGFALAVAALGIGGTSARAESVHRNLAVNHYRVLQVFQILSGTSLEPHIHGV